MPLTIKTIFISNLAEIAKPVTQYMTEARKREEIFEDHAYCDRFVWAETDNRLLITPFPIDEQFFSEVNKTLGFKNVINLYPQKIKQSLCQAIIKDEKLLKKLIGLIRGNPNIRIISYAATEEFNHLVSFLKKQGLSFQTPELPEEKNRWLTDFFDSKSGFRQAASQLGKEFPSMPQGVICDSQQSIIGWAKHFYQENKAFVLKINRGLAGEGVKIVRREDINGQKIDDFISRLLKKEPYWQKGVVVVEKYIVPDLKTAGGSPNIEIKIEDQRVNLLYTCAMRISHQGVFMGIELGKKAVPLKINKTLTLAGRKFAFYLAKLGYQGFFEIDWVYGRDGKLYPLEANLRRTGGTHVYELAKRLLGDNFLDHYYLISQMKVEAAQLRNRSYSFVKNRLQSLLYPLKGKKEGVVLTLFNYLKKGKLGYVVIARNKKRAVEIEKKLLQLI